MKRYSICDTCPAPGVCNAYPGGCPFQESCGGGMRVTQGEHITVFEDEYTVDGDAELINRIFG